MDPVTLIVPGRLETLTGGYGYDRRIVEGLCSLGWAVDVRELDESFPFPTRAALDDAVRQLAAIPSERAVIVDGLALGAMPDEVEREAKRLKLVAIVHHPLAAESGLDARTAEALEISERRALATTRAVVVTSRRTVGALAKYGVPPERVDVVEPGTDRAPLARGSNDGAVQLLSVASIIPRKGHETLVRALSDVADRNWRLECIGSIDRDPPTAARVRALIVSAGLAERVTLAGEMTGAALDAEYDRADVFVLPTRYEGYGMAIAEALARGLPVVSTSTGAIAELVGSEAGLLVPPDNVPQLTAALSAVIGHSPLRARLAEGARRVREALPTWEHAAARMAEVISRVQH
jgi:glycosyltransferase involved in cell wall biosynthesis